MRISLSTSLLILAAAATVAASAKNPADYPLRVQIVDTHWNQGSIGTSGYGHGNLKDGDSWQGFVFTFSCGRPFLASDNPAALYLAKWKKPQTRLAIVVAEIGNSDNQRECELKTTTVRDVLFSMNNGQLVSRATEVKRFDGRSAKGIGV